MNDSNSEDAIVSHDVKKKSRTVSIRVPEEIISEIEKDAETRLISTNMLINQILHRYTSWGKHREKMKMFPISSEVIKSVLNDTPESKLSQLADMVFNSIREFALITKHKFSLETSLYIIKTYCTMFWISYDESSPSSSALEILIHHNLEKNASIIIEKVFEKIFWDLKKIRPDITITERSVMITTSTYFR